MCEEELSSTLKRVSEEDLVTNLQRDLASFFEQKYGRLTFQFHSLVPQEQSKGGLENSSPHSIYSHLCFTRVSGPTAPKTLSLSQVQVLRKQPSHMPGNATFTSRA